MRSEEGTKKSGHLGMAQSESNWLVTWLGEPLKEIILQNDVSNGICVNFYSRTTLRETFMSKNIGFPSYQNRQFTFPSETTSISVILIWESHPTPPPPPTPPPSSTGRPKRRLRNSFISEHTVKYTNQTQG